MLTNEPNGMIVSEEGIVSWTPTEGVLSSGLIALEVSDGDLFDEQAFEIIVTSVNDAPELVQEFSNISVSEGSPSETISLLEYFNDPDGDDLDYFVDEDLDFITVEISEDQLIISFIIKGFFVGFFQLFVAFIITSTLKQEYFNIIQVFLIFFNIAIIILTFSSIGTTLGLILSNMLSFIQIVIFFSLILCHFL